MIDRYPISTALTPEALDASGWREALADAKRDGYSAMWVAFSNSAKVATEARDYPKARVLWLLADLSSMMLKPESPSEPFKPILEMAGGRSAVPADIPDDALFFMDAAVGRIDDVLLKARLHDLLWVRVKSKPAHATAAIDAYTQVPIDSECWLRDGRDCWQRAIQLCQQLGKGSGARLAGITDKLLAAIAGVGPTNGYLGIWIAHALGDAGVQKEQAQVVAGCLSSLATRLAAQLDRHKCIDHWIEAARWHALSDNKQMQAKAHVAAADIWVQLADECAASGKPLHAEAASHMESAIQTYRQVPRALRHDLAVDSKIQEAHRRMTEYGGMAVGEMGTIKSEPFDITDMVQCARSAVQGKQVLEALRGLAMVHGIADVQRDRDFARQMVREHPLQHLFGAKILAGDGRVVAKVPSSGPKLQAGDEDAPAIRAQMLRHHAMRVGLAVQGSILPALEVMKVEHRLRVIDFAMMARRSGLVSIGREGLVGKGLFFGWDGDWAAAVHVLVPQVEHMVRVPLKEAGGKTTVLDSRGIEQEVGLSTLMEDPKADQVLGPNMAWEIRALLCDPVGPNMRNEIAHGLVDDGIGTSVFSCYTWWLVLRLVATPFWNAARENWTNHNATPGSDGASAEAGDEESSKA